MGIIAVAISHAIDRFVNGVREYGRSMRSVLPLKCNSLFEYGSNADSAPRRAVRDKMLEIPDSLNECGTTNKRHSTRIVRTWIRAEMSNACRDRLELFGDRKHRAKI